MIGIKNKTLGEGLLWGCVLVLTLAFFFRQTLLSGFDLAVGGLGDSRLMMFLMEHWWLVFQGAVTWNEPLYLQGAEGILASTDTFFIQGVVYSFFRALGFDMFGAWHWVWFCWTAIGFLSMGWLLRRELKLPLVFSLLGSVFFLIAHPTYLILNAHLQLLSICMVPLLVIAGIRIFHNWNSSGAAVYGWGALFAVVYGLLALSTFYIVWMATFYACLAGVIWYLGRTLSLGLSFRKWRIEGSAEFCPESGLHQLLCSRRFYLLAGLLILGLLPFLGLYLPLRVGDGGWPYKVAFEGLPRPADWFNLGAQNWLYGSTLDQNAPAREYGHTPLIWGLIFLMTLYVGFRSSFHGHWVRILLLTNLCLILLLTRVFGFSAWIVVFELVPGGDVIRAPFRVAYIVYVTFPILLAWGGSRLSEKSIRMTLLAGILAMLLFLEQGNTGAMARQSRSEWQAYLASVPPPPEGVKTFAVEPKRPQTEASFLLQARAMLLAAEWRIPTINGLTGRFPKGYNHFFSDRPFYRHAAEVWALRYGLHENAFWYDEGSRKWSRFEGVDFGPIGGWEGKNLVRHPEHMRIFIEGFSVQEDWGIWSDGPQSKLLIPSPGVAAELFIDWYAFLPSKGDTLTVSAWLDERKAGEWTFPGSPHEVRIPLPVHSEEGGRFHTLHLEYDSPRRPIDHVSGSTDRRLLGVGLRRLSLHPLPASAPGS
jgi:hypothetical protein